MSVPILKYGGALVASVQTELNDSDWADLRDRMLRQAATERTKAALVDVTGMDVLGFIRRPSTQQHGGDVATARGGDRGRRYFNRKWPFSMVQLGLRLEGVRTALDLEEGAECCAPDRSKGWAACLLNSHVLIRNEADIVEARQRGRSMASELGLSATNSTLVATAISEVAPQHFDLRAARRDCAHAHHGCAGPSGDHDRCP